LKLERLDVAEVVEAIFLEEERRMRRIVFGAAALTGLLHAGCGPTNQDLLNDYRDRFDVRRKQFAVIADKLPEKGATLENGCKAPLVVKPVYDEKAKSYNLEIVMEPQLKDPDVRLDRATALDLNVSGGLLRGMQWTGPKNPMAERVLNTRAEASLRAQLEEAVATRYLLVNRAVSYTPPKALDEKTFTKAEADVEAFLYELQSGELLCSFRFSAVSEDSVHYEYKESDDPKDRLESFAYSTLWVHARKEEARLLTELTKGTFAFDSD
jgi:hypothetical protein